MALLAGAHGVHLGAEDLPPEAARTLLGPHRLIGVTVRSVAEIESAALAGADYVGLGPVFASRTKRLPVAPLGLEGFKAIARTSQLPVVAISGIGLDTLEAVASAGAHAAAMASELLLADDIALRAGQLIRAFERGDPARPSAIV